MARQATGSVLAHDGPRGRSWSMRYTDASGKRVRETLGHEPEWNQRKANEALQERLVAVRKDGHRKAAAVTFEGFAREWLETYPEAKSLKRSTRQGYESIVEKHLLPVFGRMKVGAIGIAELDRYFALRRRQGYSARTINRHLNLLSLLFGSAARKGLLTGANPVSLVDRPREPRKRWTILAPEEVARVVRAFAELLEDEADEFERRMLAQARVVFLTVIGAGLRRGELLGLRWKDVRLADPAGAVLQVRETFVRDRADTPKSDAGERTIALGPVLAGELFDHRARTSFEGDDERVFCHPLTGGPLDHKRYAKTLRAALAKAKIDRPMRPFHDGRHTSITNAAAAGTAPAALMARAGHSDFKTTQGYIDLAGETFREEAERLEERVFASLPK